MDSTKDFKDKRLLNVHELRFYLGMGECNAVKWAKGIGAERRIGRRLLFDKWVIDKAISNQASNESES